MEKLLEQPVVEKLKPNTKVSFRGSEHIKAINELALTLCDGDYAKARRMLLILACLDNKGATWDVRLVAADEKIEGAVDNEDRGLLPFADITAGLASLLAIGDEELIRMMTSRVVERVSVRPYDFPLFVIMMRKLFGEKGVDELKKCYSLDLFDETQISKSESIYNELEGKSFWEISPDVLCRLIFSMKSLYERGLEMYDEILGELNEMETEDLKQEKQEGEMILCDLRNRMRRVAKIMLARQLVGGGIIDHSDKSMMTHAELVSLLD